MKPAHTDCTPEEPRNLQQDSRHKPAHSAVQSRSDRWAQSSCSAAEDIQGLQSKSAALLGSRQASLLFSMCNAPFICKLIPGHMDVHSGMLMRGRNWCTSPFQHAVHLARGALMPITEVQALTSAVQRTHSSRLALAALMPILARRAAAGCAQSGASYWHGLGCSLANMPLVYLLLMHVLLIAAAAAPLLATGESMMAQVWNC